MGLPTSREYTAGAGVPIQPNAISSGVTYVLYVDVPSGAGIVKLYNTEVDYDRL